MSDPTRWLGFIGAKPRDPAEQIAAIVGCELVDGHCVTHQRPTDPPRDGCPMVATMMRHARGGAR